MAIAVFVAGGAALGCRATPATAWPRVRLSAESEAHATLVVDGLSTSTRSLLATLPAEDPRWTQLVQVFTSAGPPPAGHPPLLGRAHLEGRRLRFQPRFPFVPGLPHHARFDGALVEAAPAQLDFTLAPPERTPRARVVAFHPGAGIVPANLLRCYVHFSEPMRARDVLRHVRLLDDTGAPIPEPFLDVEHGLWDPDRTRLTLFLHPGRIKRGVGPNDELGPPLLSGKRYRLVIDASLEDAAGQPLVEAFTVALRAGPRDESSPDPHAWTVRAPASANGALELSFGEPLDQALALRLIDVETADGRRVPGRARVSATGERWSWMPARPWTPGEYAVVVHPALEDLAGNAVGHRFEERLHGGSFGGPENAVPIRLAFEVRAR